MDKLYENVFDKEENSSQKYCSKVYNQCVKIHIGLLMSALSPQLAKGDDPPYFLSEYRNIMNRWFLFEQFFRSLVVVTIAGDRAANLDLFLALAAFSSESSFMCHTSCDM
jgi:hypothetical protein